MMGKRYDKSNLEPETMERGTVIETTIRLRQPSLAKG